MGDIFHFAKKIARSKVARNIGKMALEQLPGGIEELSGKIKNKRLKKILGSENLVNYSAAYGIKQTQQNSLAIKIFYLQKFFTNKNSFTVKKIYGQKILPSKSFSKTFLLSKNFFAIKQKIFTVKKKLFDYNLIILKGIVIVAGISNHTIIDFILKS